MGGRSPVRGNIGGGKGPTIECSLERQPSDFHTKKSWPNAMLAESSCVLVTRSADSSLVSLVGEFGPWKVATASV
ncbi:unnamed protein product [Protopolystoma xenopodis]|uniref:Uncharacterized protein n=1 Tax=Protopolystoma xenopodis TaxID=117903 RepID=A0A448XKQ0_9PLAT|nr:unnamed protein product [Protopolystoma xenopodis]